MLFINVAARAQGLKQAIGIAQRRVLSALKKERPQFKELDLRTLPFSRPVTDLILQMEIRQVFIFASPPLHCLLGNFLIPFFSQYIHTNLEFSMLGMGRLTNKTCFQTVRVSLNKEVGAGGSERM